jgi:DNA polymerase
MTTTTDERLQLLRELAAALRFQAWCGADTVERPAAGAALAAAPARDVAPVPTAAAPTLPTGSRTVAGLRPAGADAELALAQLRTRIGTCTRCPLHHGRRKIVHGNGDPKARLFVVGTGPGAAEDGTGLPFQGETGALLDKMLAAMGLQRDQVWLTTLVLCRLPASGRPPREALAACGTYLRAQLEAVRPAVVLALGETAAQFIMKSDTSLEQLRGGWHEALGVPALATHGLDDLIAHPEHKRAAWQDLQAVMAKLGLARPSL